MATVNSYVTLDLMRPNNTLYDLTPSFNGRVGDSQSYAKIWFKSNGLNYDLTDKTVEFDGVDPKGTPFKVNGTAAADQTGDGLATGRVTFYFPAECFQVPGDWDDDSTFFAILDADGNRVSTVNVHLHVLDDKVSMGINAKPFITDFEKLKEQILAECKTIEDGANDALKLITDPNSQLMVTMNALKTQVEAYQTAVKNNTFATESDLQAVQAQLHSVKWTIIADASKDLNSIVTEGKYWIQGTSVNDPVSSWSYMFVDAAVEDCVLQRLVNVVTADVYVRTLSMGVWCAWKQVTFW